MFKLNLSEATVMTSKKSTFNNILVSLFFAFAMILCSYFIADEALSKTVILMLIAVWLIPTFYLNKKAKNKEKDSAQ
jgi:Ca2+/Na+ antiporter